MYSKRNPGIKKALRLGANVFYLTGLLGLAASCFGISNDDLRFRNAKNEMERLRGEIVNRGTRVREPTRRILKEAGLGHLIFFDPRTERYYLRQVQFRFDPGERTDAVVVRAEELLVVAQDLSRSSLRQLINGNLVLKCQGQEVFVDDVTVENYLVDNHTLQAVEESGNGEFRKWFTDQRNGTSMVSLPSEDSKGIQDFLSVVDNAIESLDKQNQENPLAGLFCVGSMLSFLVGRVLESLLSLTGKDSGRRSDDRDPWD